MPPDTSPGPGASAEPAPPTGRPLDALAAARETARRLLAGRPQATLATLIAPSGVPPTDQDGSADDTAPVGGWPYPSLVMVALDDAGRPLLLLSELALHTRNLRQDGRAALLFEDTAGLENPLTGPRLSVMGHIAPLAGAEAEAARAAYLDRHPSAALYADFPDFRFWRMGVAQAHLVAGFGRIHWLAAADLRA
ncbi:pyridoxamine 5'-phosphate oxidase family protein [Nitrospirillum sp. BR 11828]|uniref:pyridoxamine 5'-phosphate oxidase family protein n=1 Tax=Nitrospirillum sp. BR 11828 TaxID=3104325 RepID=UPI002ACA7F9F|nr:pyridoxamine 5'-phosphate oxidase family protein [Nitrospirillum sp. BR 11828]MDZ5646851.1 pyridoxamine 5'-phosphate oxidase family protein [Nitrospirillum sp. BR 11828]